MTARARLTQVEIMNLAARGMGRIDLYGARGVTLVSLEELEAMACALAILGLRAIHPIAAEYAAPDEPEKPLKGPADV